MNILTLNAAMEWAAHLTINVYLKIAQTKGYVLKGCVARILIKNMLTKKSVKAQNVRKIMIVINRRTTNNGVWIIYATITLNALIEVNPILCVKESIA